MENIEVRIEADLQDLLSKYLGDKAEELEGNIACDYDYEQLLQSLVHFINQYK